MFNRVSLVSLKVKDSCVDCGRCKELCPMDLDFRKEINSENCIKCMLCVIRCPDFAVEVEDAKGK